MQRSGFRVTARGALGFILALGTTATPAKAQGRDAATGRALYEAHCAMCHGDRGHGDGQGGATLQTRPPDLTKIAHRRDGIWPLLEVMSIIDGYTKATTPREDMPIVPEITEGPMIDFDPGNGISVPTPLHLVALATYLETIQSPPPDRYVP